MNYQEINELYELNIYPRRNITLVRGSGALLWDDLGNEYIDCSAGIGVANVGHANSDVAAAISHQAQTLLTCANVFFNDVRAQLVEKLVQMAPPGLDRVFLCNSGAESIEAAIKFARLAGGGRSRFVCATRGFHGRTMGALSATFKKEYREPFQPVVPGFEFVPFNDFEKLSNAVNENTAAIILEPVQGEGGVRIPGPDYFQNVQNLCKERRVLLIIDEIQTGFCRTGKMFACEHYGLVPDLLCLAKAIAGGVPMGAVLCGGRIDVKPGQHGSTFGGNPLACSAALAAIHFMEVKNLAIRAADLGDYFIERFAIPWPPIVRSVRQIGLMIGIELKERAQPYLVRLLELGILALPAGPTVIRLLPPLVINEAQLDRVVQALREALR
ncbi:MAG: acetylornithine/succinylornithine family transaminase [Gammaproteobacteria bacterium]|nr:acetylornithine/succinylornithine family transaminase [Gammaproteobacteria bacterium]MDH3464479.1 acetylornithine/succinylornithine family transaminase [Gammaproteobacteria bacterium]